METNILILITIALLGGGAAFLLPPVAQPQSYHDFADSRKMLGIPNCLDVLSNLPFCMVGLVGILKVAALMGDSVDSALLMPYIIFFTGLFLTGLGSGWYHLRPDNKSLVWDRLPMTVAFAGFFCSVLSELVTPRWGMLLLVPLLLIGVFSVCYWIATERHGRGDLRLYAVFQFLPMLLIPLMLMLFEGPAGYKSCIVGLIGFYALAKALESLDGVIYSRGRIVSGHTLKHFAAAAGAWCLLIMLEGRGQF